MTSGPGTWPWACKFSEPRPFIYELRTETSSPSHFGGILAGVT